MLSNKGQQWGHFLPSLWGPWGDRERKRKKEQEEEREREKKAEKEGVETGQGEEARWRGGWWPLWPQPRDSFLGPPSSCIACEPTPMEGRKVNANSSLFLSLFSTSINVYKSKSELSISKVLGLEMLADKDLS